MLGHRIAPRLQLKAAIGLLQMDGDRIVYAAGNAVVGQGFDQGIASLNTQDVQMIHVAGIGGFFRGDRGAEPANEFVVDLGMHAPARVIGVQILEFHSEDGGLDPIHAGVPTDGVVVVLPGLAMVAQDLDSVG